ncbi:MAG: tetratricopeptide repeat protein [Candidatus Hodarchaeota archaeon]
MNEALKRCDKESVVLHLRGIEGIGKSALLEHWSNSDIRTIRLDCEQYADLFSRLDMIARGVIHEGVQLKRFDVIWNIRKRFIEGVEPAKEKRFEWADVLAPIPFIGTVAGIGAALGAIGEKVAPKLRSKLGEVEKWLQGHLGKQYVERLLRLLWKEPRQAELLHLEAILEDIKNRKISEEPLLFMLDNFEYVDTRKRAWPYEGRKMSEAELWYVFLSQLSNCVGVVACSKSPPDRVINKIGVEQTELTELDEDSSRELLELRDVGQTNLQDRIISVSGGNPFVIDAICDLIEEGDATIDDVECIRADTLEEVRLKTWRTLFSHVEDLQDIVNRAGLLPFFNRQVMEVVVPTLTVDQWDRLIRLSFITDRGNGTWVLREIARELVIAELGKRLKNITDETANLLEDAFLKESDYSLLGLSLSVKAEGDERKKGAEAARIVSELTWRHGYSDALTLVDSIKINTDEGHIILQGLRGTVLAHMNRVADGEHALREALELIHELGEDTPDELLVHLARIYRDLGVLLYKIERASDSEECLRKSLDIYRKLDENTLGYRKEDFAWALLWFGWVLIVIKKLDEGAKACAEANQIFKALPTTPSYNPSRGVLATLRNLGSGLFMAGKSVESEAAFREVLEIYRIRVKEQPESLSDMLGLGIILSNLGELLRSTDRPDEAIGFFREARTLFEEMVQQNKVYRLVLANTLNNLAFSLKLTGKFHEADVVYKEAIRVARELAKEEPEAHSDLVAWALLDSAVLYSQIGRVKEAEKACKEALEIHKKLAQKSPGRFKDMLAWNMNNHGVMLSRADRLAESEKVFDDAIKIAEEIRQESPEVVFLDDLAATILNNQAVVLRKSGKISESEETHLRAIEMRRELKKKAPELFTHRLVISLNNYSVTLGKSKREAEALKSLKEALRILRKLVNLSPKSHSRNIAIVLNNLGILYGLMEKQSASKKAFLEAQSIIEELKPKLALNTEELMEIEEEQANPITAV